ncbi:NupC/NupG family nucleoside CNT transporter [Paludibacterium paludis]|uniref:Nucleoside transporter n=1 Tax=Paludibacterium paludis TaxID=1225769 RepID=A0A918P733_9NEIS|nr:nucleoside transporter C-terminal domain-containing protein [Paludibacterium paludis]GGY25416.1 nucleoside transporter [Paludibacterium paludis]
MLFQTFAGVLLLLAMAWGLSTNRRAIAWRTVATGLAIQSALYVLITYVPAVNAAFSAMGDGFARMLAFSAEGAGFVFGDLARPARFGFVFAFVVLPVVIFFSALSAMCYHLGLLQRVVAMLAWVMTRAMRLSGRESLVVAANIFLGQTEAPLLIRPYIASLTRSELATVMIAGMGTLSASVMAAYVSFLGGNDPLEQAKFARFLLTASFMNAASAAVFAKILFPETACPSQGDSAPEPRQERGSLISAIVGGALDGMKMAGAIATILIAIVSLIAMANFLLREGPGDWFGLNALIRTSTSGVFQSLTLEYLFGQVFRVFAFLMGISWAESLQVGSLIGQKIVINEFIAYLDLARMKQAGTLSAPSVMVATYALASFSNFGSIGICVAGIGSLAENQKGALAGLGLRALAGAVMAGLMTATVANLWQQIL